MTDISQAVSIQAPSFVGAGVQEIFRSNVNLQDMLGEALDEIQYLKVKHRLGHKALKLLQRKACLSSEAAESGLVRLKKQTAEAEKRVEGQLLAQEVQLSAVWLDVQQWKRRSALLQLKLDSLHEDLDHLKLEKSLLTSEFDAQAHLRSTTEAQYADAQASVKRLQTEIQDATAKQLAAETNLCEAEQAAAATKQALVEGLEIATARFGALEEHAKLAEQKASSAQERAALLEARLVGREAELHKDLAAATERAAKLEARLAESEADLAKRLSLAEERMRMTDGLSQDRVQAAGERAAFLEETLRQQVKEMQLTLENERKERQSMERASSERVEALSKQLQATEVAVGQLESQIRTKDRRIAALEEVIPSPSETRNEMANVALGMVSSMVDQLGSPISSKPPPAYQVAHPAPSAVLAAAEKAPKAALDRAADMVVSAEVPEASTFEAGRDAAGEAEEAGSAPSEGVQNASAKGAGLAKAGKKAKASPKGKRGAKAQTMAKTKGVAKAKLPAARKADATVLEAAVRIEAQAAGSSPEAAIGVGRRPVRQRAKAKPYWLGACGQEDTPATLSPSPLSPDSEAGDDPYTMPPPRKSSPAKDLAAAEASKQKGALDGADELALAEAGKKGRQAGRKRQPAKERAALPAQDMEEVEDTAMLAMPMAKQGEDAGGAMPLPEAQLDRQDGPAEEASEKGAGKVGAGQRRTRASLQAEDVRPEDRAAKKRRVPATVEEQHATETEAQQGADQIPAREVQAAQQLGEADEQAKQAPAAVKKGKGATRPLGMSKIDLTAVWGDTATPAGTPAEGSGPAQGKPPKRAAAANAGHAVAASEDGMQNAGKENADRNEAAGAVAAAGRPSKPGSKLSSDPLAGLNPKVLEAAAAHSRPSNGSLIVQLGTRRSSQMPANQDKTSKRKLLNPSSNQDLLPRDLLLGTGTGVMIPKLRKP